MLRASDLPRLVIVGEEDMLTPPEESRKMVEGHTGSTLVVMPRTGHLPNLEQPKAFNEHLTAFLLGYSAEVEVRSPKSPTTW